MEQSWSVVDRQIREARERSEFDDLPGAGKPLPDRGELHDEEWWLKDLIRRENLTWLAPASLQVRKESEELMDRLAGVAAESEVRHIVALLNDCIELARRGLIDGPPVAFSATPSTACSTAATAMLAPASAAAPASASTPAARRARRSAMRSR